jgi:hypothetical protein
VLVLPLLKQQDTNMPSIMEDFFPSKWLRGDDLRGRTAATIVELRKEVIGRERAEKAVLVLRNLKPLILNRENAERLVQALGTDDYTRFPGMRIALSVEQREWDGKQLRVVLIDPVAPAPRQMPEPAPAPAVDDSDPEWEEL